MKRASLSETSLRATAALQRPRDKKLRLADVKEMFLQMRDHT
jgi:dephospho-CoA kinase